jgi:hypothetical protein
MDSSDAGSESDDESNSNGANCLFSIAKAHSPTTQHDISLVDQIPTNSLKIIEEVRSNQLFMERNTGPVENNFRGTKILSRSKPLPITKRRRLNI